jgi:hypothetical protein
VTVQVGPLPGGSLPGGPVARLFSQVLPDVLRAMLGFSLVGGVIVACGVVLYAVVIFLSRSDRWLRRAWAAATRTRPRMAALGAVLVLMAGLAARAALYQPLVPLPAGSPLAAELWDIFLAAEDAERRILDEGEPVTLLARYYADVPGYRQLTSQERGWIIEAFGPERLKGAAMLTARQANLVVLFGALPAPSAPNPLGTPVLRPPTGYPSAPVLRADHAIAYWINLLGNRAAMRVSSCGRHDYLFHKSGDGWKIVHIRVLEPCRG